MYYIYKITNKINGKYYIGKRKNKDPLNDKYMGSGKLIKLAIEKYGADNFIKEIIYIFETEEEAAISESELVNNSTLKDELCYNLHEGGFGGFAHINSYSIEERPNIKKIREMINNGSLIMGGTKNWTEESREKVKLQSWGNKIKRGNFNPNNWEKYSPSKKKELSSKMSKSAKENNSQSGKIWCIEENAENLSGRKSFFEIPEGWISTTEWRDMRKKKNSPNYGRKWYNDGVKNFYLKCDDVSVEFLKIGKCK